jgi:ketosteroid isomerase-like protein
MTSIALVIAMVFVIGLPGVVTAESEQDGIIKVIEGLRQTFNARDVDAMLSFYADDAHIDSRIAGAKVSKAKYGEAMTAFFKKGNAPNIQFRQLKVMILDADHAVVDGEQYAGSSGDYVQWKFEKRDGKWLVLEFNYKK